MARKKPFIAGKPPQTRCGMTGLKRDDLIDEQKRWSMRDDIGGLGELGHACSASSSFIGVSFGLILYHA